LAQNAGDLSTSERNSDCNKLEDGLKILENVTVSYIQEVKQNYEQQKQESDTLKENDLIICLKDTKEELILQRNSNALLIEQLEITDKSLEMHVKQIQELISKKEQRLKYTEKCHEQMKQQNEKLNKYTCTSEANKAQEETNFKDIDELKAKNECLQKEITYLGENNSLCMEQLKEKDKYVETLKQQLEDLDCQRKSNLTYIDELKAKIASLQKEIHSVEEEYSRYREEMKGEDLQALKKRVEDMNSERERNLKYIGELQTDNVFLQEQIDSLEEKSSVNVEQVKEQDNYLETLKQEIADLNCARKEDLKYIDEVKADISNTQTDMHFLREENAMYLEEIEEKNNYLGMLKQYAEDLNCVKEHILKYVNELTATHKCLQKQTFSLEQKNFVYMEQLKQKDNSLETLKRDSEVLEISLGTLEKEKKGLELKLGILHTRLFNSESEVQKLKSKAAAMRYPLLKESHDAGHNISKHGALCCSIQSQLTEAAGVLKSSVATNTDISGTLYCVFFTMCTLTGMCGCHLFHLKN
jgi:chromosome segregation ATPase